MKEIKELSEVLHLYLQQKCLVKTVSEAAQQYLAKEGAIVNIDPITLQCVYEKHLTVSPILRRLSSMTEEERNEVAKLVPSDENPLWVKSIAVVTLWYLKNGFWIFGDDAFEKGLIIDADGK